MSDTSFNEFADKYNEAMGDEGDYSHKTVIDPALFDAIGEIKNKSIYDIGCGNGYVARKLLKMGAKEVWASDISPNMIQIAEENYDCIGINYMVRDATDFEDIPEGKFDIVIMNMVIHYIQDLDTLFSRVSKVLKPKGKFVFTTDHPLHSKAYFEMLETKEATSENDTKTKIEIDLSEKLKSKAEKYLIEEEMTIDSLWDKSKKLKMYKRPFSTYINTLNKHGFAVDVLIETPTKRVDSENNIVESSIPFKFALGAIKLN